MELVLVDDDGLSQKMKYPVSDGGDIFDRSNLFQEDRKFVSP
jgi:hypothetical protein